MFKLPFKPHIIPPGSINIKPIKKFNKYINMNLLVIIYELLTGKDWRNFHTLDCQIKCHSNKYCQNNIEKLETGLPYMLESSSAVRRVPMFFAVIIL